MYIVSTLFHDAFVPNFHSKIFLKVKKSGAEHKTSTCDLDIMCRNVLDVALCIVVMVSFMPSTSKAFPTVNNLWSGHKICE